MRRLVGYSAASAGILVGLLLTYWPTARTVAMYMAGRGGGCSLEACMEAPGRWQRVLAAIDRMRETTRVVEAAGDIELWQTEHGQFWVTSNTVSDNFLRFLAEDEVGIYGSGELGVHRGDVVLDCGAAHGTFTRAALEAGASLVVAVEPQPANVACLNRTFAAEVDQGTVIVFPKGVWDREDELELTLSLNPYESTFARSIPEAGTIRVPLTTIDNLVEELQLDRVDFIKMDIEGAEQQALAGAADTLRKFTPRMAVSVNHLPEDPEKIPALVQAMVPRYKMTWEQCGVSQGYRIRPGVAVFDSPASATPDPGVVPGAP